MYLYHCTCRADWPGLVAVHPSDNACGNASSVWFVRLGSQASLFQVNVWFYVFFFIFDVLSASIVCKLF